jgi:hypothetical protein
MAPARLLAAHAIELYLNAFLLAVGTSPQQIRGFHHDFASMAKLAFEKGLLLRQKTVQHMCRMTERREYLVLRYGPEQVPSAADLTRVQATLKEVSEKVQRVVRPQGRTAA